MKTDKNKPKISIVLGSYNRKPFLKEAIKSIRENGISVPYEIVVIDGGSDDGSIDYLVKQEDVISIIQHNKGEDGAPTKRSWGYFMNIAFRATHGKYIVMLSDDCLVLKDSIMNAYRLFEEQDFSKKKTGAIAFYFRNYPIDSNYYVINTYSFKLFVNHGMYLREALEEVGFIEEDLYDFYYADGDLCCKLWQSGYQVLDCPQAIVEHFFYANPKLRDRNCTNKAKNLEDFRERWKDIYYDPVENHLRSKKFISFVDRDKIAKKFHRHILYYYGKLRGYLKSFFDKPRAVEIRVLAQTKHGIIYKKSLSGVGPQLPAFSLDSKDLCLAESRVEKYCLEELGCNNIKNLELIWQLGLKPEPEIYFFKVVADFYQESSESDGAPICVNNNAMGTMCDDIFEAVKSATKKTVPVDN